MIKNDEKSEKKFRYGDKNLQLLVNKIENACDGLVYISETDAPVTPFLGDVVEGEVRSDTILRQTGNQENEKVRETSFEKFFGRLTADREWHGEREQTRAMKFLDLQKLIEENLTDPKVFKIGDIRIRIYAVGIDSGRRLLGIMTHAVET